MRVCVFTGSRGEWGYLKPILLSLEEQEGVEYEIVVTNMHILPEYGYTANEIIKDGFDISYYIPVFGTADSNIAIVKAMSQIMSSVADIFFSKRYDYCLVAGDRFESLAAVTAAFYSDVPVAHVQAGERSGNKDDSARHSIARLASLHFCSNDDAKLRLEKSGEQLWRIHNTGAPQLDGISRFIQKKRRLKNQCLCIVHPETLGFDKPISVENIKIFLNKKGFHCHWILPNSDNGSKELAQKIIKFADGGNTIYRNLKREKFLELLANVSILIGNSSSAILEAPTFKTPAINIGKRQMQRVQASNIINIDNASIERLEYAYKIFISKDYNDSLIECINPYGDGESSRRIVKILLDNINNSELIRKRIMI
jgi:GDP/UDP-N,N'-diacetylbacillosamine 2-epimerase (hydrolysing)